LLFNHGSSDDPEMCFSSFKRKNRISIFSFPELEKCGPAELLSAVQKEVLDQIERRCLGMALKNTNGRVGQIAGIHPRGSYNKMS